jgi:hypothetical protein
MRGIAVSGVSPGRSFSNHPEHDRDHETKRQDCSKSVKSYLHCHAITSRYEKAIDFVRLSLSKRG